MFSPDLNSQLQKERHEIHISYFPTAFPSSLSPLSSPHHHRISTEQAGSLIMRQKTIKGGNLYVTLQY